MVIGCPPTVGGDFVRPVINWRRGGRRLNLRRACVGQPKKLDAGNQSWIEFRLYSVQTGTSKINTFSCARRFAGRSENFHGGQVYVER